MQSDTLETLFGGAAGGGKSHGQLLDALRFAVCYPGSRQLMLRRTMPELERSLVPAALRLYPQCIAKYKVSEHRWDFANGSALEFGYCDAESDVTRYQSAEYDVIRFDELTHFTESQFTYLLSRIRGTNGFPKQVKATTNPGGVGHQWVKSRFIDSMPPDTVREFDGGTRLFLPARLGDNPFLRGCRLRETPEAALSCRPESTARRRVGAERGTVFQLILTRPARCKAVCHPARLAALPDHRLRSGYAGSALDRAKSGRTQRGLPRTLPSGTHHFGCSGADACL